MIKPDKPVLTLPAKSFASGQTALSRPDAPDFESMFDDGDDNPLAEIEMTGELQADADTGMSEALRAIIERKKATQERFRVATDPEFYLCVVFQSREQKEAFLQAADWADLGGKFINGLEVARRMAIPIDPIPIEPLKIRGKVKKFTQSDTLTKGGK